MYLQARGKALVRHLVRVLHVLASVARDFPLRRVKQTLKNISLSLCLTRFVGLAAPGDYMHFDYGI